MRKVKLSEIRYDLIKLDHDLSHFRSKYQTTEGEISGDIDSCIGQTLAQIKAIRASLNRDMVRMRLLDRAGDIDLLIDDGIELKQK